MKNPSAYTIIETPRLALLAIDMTMISEFLSNPSKLEDKLGLNFEEGWNTLGNEIFEYIFEKLIDDPESFKWWLYFFVHKKDNKIIGTGGYKGVPDGFGMVEIGYEIAKTYQQQGLATEAAEHLTQTAFEDYRVCHVQAHTVSKNDPSTKVLKKCGFEYKEYYQDEEGDVTIFRWENLRPELRMDFKFPEGL